MISVVIATYKREETLIDTIEQLLDLSPCADEIIVVDQSPRHSAKTQAALRRFASEGRIRHILMSRPSIPAAMNRGLLAAVGETVLFVDDDVSPGVELIAAHARAHGRSGRLVAGRVVQPWRADGGAACVSSRPADIHEVVGCNFSVERTGALAIGGFDENFVGAAYCFEAEFAHRWRASGRDLFFEPRACLRHLKVASGGTRAYGSHLTTARPDHSVGAYYLLFKTWAGWRSARATMMRPIRAVATRFHLRKPWWIVVTLVAEARGAALALRLLRRGPAYIDGRQERRNHV